MSDKYVDAEAVVEQVGQIHELTGIRRLSGGIESTAFLARSREWGPVVVKVPLLLEYANVNDPNAEAGQLFEQESVLFEHLRSFSFAAVPEPCAHGRVGNIDYSICTYVEGDGSVPDPVNVGWLLAQLHAMPIPNIATSAQEGMVTSSLIPARLLRRLKVFEELTRLPVPMPPESVLQEMLIPLDADAALLHLDVRAVNLVASQGNVRALLDWSNSLIGPRQLEWARLRELSDVEWAGFKHGYQSVAPAPAGTAATELVFRCDAAVMLSLVFLSEAPDPESARRAVGRALELCTEVRALD